MVESKKKLVLFVIGLATFALLGTGLFYVSGYNTPGPPELAEGFSFRGGFSAEDLGLSNTEIWKLNGTLKRNESVVDNTTLTVMGTDHDLKGDEIGSDSLLTFTMEVKSREGMIFSPEEISCLRRSLISKIAYYLDLGAKVLARYADEPVLKGREVKILDM